MKNREKGLTSLREIISVCVCVCVCVCKSKEKQQRFFFSHETRETFTKNYCNWFDNSEIIWSLSRDFSLQRERVLCVNICVIVCDCYFGLLILLIILVGTQQVVSKLKLEWKWWPKKKAMLCELRSLIEQTLGIRAGPR